MKERPILFSGPMVRAILEGRKTQTRRALKPQPPKQTAVVDPYNHDIEHFTAWTADNKMMLSRGNIKNTAHWRCPYGLPGDRLWVRESFCSVDNTEFGGTKWKPSIFMPRAASRITLEITSLRVERLQEISEDDAKAEGVSQHPNYPKEFFSSWTAAYKHLWNSINGPGSWNTNPWVWVIEFKRI